LVDQEKLPSLSGRPFGEKLERLFVLLRLGKELAYRHDEGFQESSQQQEGTYFTKYLRKRLSQEKRENVSVPATVRGDIYQIG